MKLLFTIPKQKFLDFRQSLGTASGRQSMQYYILKNLLGYSCKEYKFNFLKEEERETLLQEIQETNTLLTFAESLTA